MFAESFLFLFFFIGVCRELKISNLDSLMRTSYRMGREDGPTWPLNKDCSVYYNHLIVLEPLIKRLSMIIKLCPCEPYPLILDDTLILNH